MTDRELFNIAKDATTLSYSPYSSFSVGAALLCKSGNVYKGANIENSSFSATVCAERTALLDAVLAGEKEFVAIAVAGKKIGSDFTATPPCGICRQVLLEFCSNDFKVIFGTDDDITSVTLEDLLPHAFFLK